jgi:hypothetical protein
LVRVSRAGLRRGRRRGDQTRPGLTDTEINPMSLRPPTLPSSQSWRRPYRAAPAALLWGLTSHAASLTPDDAANHVGQNATVCGVVALTNFEADTQFWPTFLYFGRS